MDDEVSHQGYRPMIIIHKDGVSIRMLRFDLMIFDFNKDDDMLLYVWSENINIYAQTRVKIG